MSTSLSFFLPDVLENKYVRLRPLVHDDFDEMYAIASDPLLWAQHPENDRYLYDVFRLFFFSAFEHHLPFAVLDTASGAIIGSTRYYDYQPANSSIAIGYTFLSRNYWGTPYNHACKCLLLDYAFLHLDKVFFHIGAINIRSQKAVQKLGATMVRTYETQKRDTIISQQEYLLEKAVWCRQDS